MNKTLIAGALCALTLTGALAKSSSKDPVVMTIGGKDVTLGEFEYLYHKNNEQQLQPQTLDEYVDMFVNYKLKVADAEAAHIDTTSSFLKEFEGYRDDLASPYLIDQNFIDSLVHVGYDRSLTMINVDHLMLPPADANISAAQATATLDSIRALIVEGRESFADLAARYSVDRASSRRGGNMGYMMANQFPLEFENQVYALADGEISPVFATPYGFHIVRRNNAIANPGMVHARHIMVSTRGLDPNDKAVAKARIDSIYNVVTTPGADFAEVAGRLSDDKGSAAKGGDLSWFGKGRMVQEFDSVAFAMPVNTISKPFETMFGYHIIQKLGAREPASFEQSKQGIMKSLEHNNVKQIAENRAVKRYRDQYNLRIDSKGLEAAYGVIRSHNGIDSAARAELCAITLPIYTIDGNKLTVGELASTFNNVRINGTDMAIRQFDQMLERSIHTSAISTARRHLAQQNLDYRNLLGEYRDGMLLYEISNRKVWNRAATDTLGLRHYFEAHRDNYAWQKPHYKGYIVMATSDSLINLAKEMLAGTNLTGDGLNNALKEKFGKQVKAEFVVKAKGDNPIVDQVAFGIPMAPEATGRSFWKSWMVYNGRVIDQPEEVNDVKGAVSTDYQQQLEKEWIEELHKNYSVKINRKVLSKVK